MSELVRELIHVTMKQDVQQILDATNRIYGLWEDRQVNVDEYIRQLRQDRTANALCVGANTAYDFFKIEAKASKVWRDIENIIR